MTRWTATAFVLLVTATPLLVARAQRPAATQGPPPLLQINREELKIGAADAHAAWEAGYPAALAKAQSASYYLALSSVTGSPEVWFLHAYPSYAALQQNAQRPGSNAALQSELRRLGEGDAKYIDHFSSILAENIPELNVGNPDLPKMHAFQIITVRMRPGRGSAFTRYATMIRDAHAGAHADNAYAIYRVVSGMPSGTYLVLAPMPDVAYMDGSRARSAAIEKAEGAAVRDSMSKIVSDDMMMSSTQTFVVSPQMSYMSPEFRAGDPRFWR